MKYIMSVDDTEATGIVKDILIQMVDGNDVPCERESQFRDAVKEVLHYLMPPKEWEIMYENDFVDYDETKNALDVAMWSHYCQRERTVMSVGKGEECNWCGATE